MSGSISGDLQRACEEAAVLRAAACAPARLMCQAEASGASAASRHDVAADDYRRAARVQVEAVIRDSGALEDVAHALSGVDELAANLIRNVIAP